MNELRSEVNLWFYHVRFLLMLVGFVRISGMRKFPESKDPSPYDIFC